MKNSKLKRIVAGLLLVTISAYADFSDVADEVGLNVDNYFGNYGALNKVRGPASLQVDLCHSELQEKDSFSDRMAYFSELLMEPFPAKIGFLAPYYAVPSNENSYAEFGLMDKKLCRVTKSTLKVTIKKEVDSLAIERANRFATTHNDLRERAKEGDEYARNELLKHWTTFFSCLSYTESLSSADSSSSKKVAKKYAPKGFTKPDGVKFYEDKYQPVESRLNIGLYQFTPTGSGNIRPCIDAWNDKFSSCPISKSNANGNLTKIIGSHMQSFNAFCGVHKLIQTFSVQTHTTRSRSTHPDNRTGSRLKSGDDRCVTPHFYSGWAYNHFGPLMNSTGSNLSKLMKCIDQN